jgi:hypothetical protein
MASLLTCRGWHLPICLNRRSLAKGRDWIYSVKGPAPVSSPLKIKERLRCAGEDAKFGAGANDGSLSKGKEFDGVA